MNQIGRGTVFIKSHRTGELQKLSNVEDMQLEDTPVDWYRLSKKWDVPMLRRWVDKDDNPVAPPPHGDGKTLEKAALGNNMLDAVRVPPTPIGHFFPHFFKYGFEKINKESIQLRTNKGRIDLFRTNIDEKSVQYQSNNLVLTSFDNYCTIGNRSADDVFIVERYIYLPNSEIGPVETVGRSSWICSKKGFMYIRRADGGGERYQFKDNIWTLIQSWPPTPDNTPEEEATAQTIAAAMNK